MVDKSISAYIYKAVELMLSAVVRFALERGLRYPQVETLLRRALVGAASGIASTTKPMSVSTLAVLTGLQRKQVKEAQGDAAESGESILTKVVGTWQQHPEFSRNGEPKPLTASGTSSEFFELVASITSDVSPYTVLNALESSKLIRREGERVVLQSSVHLSTSEAEGLEFLAHDFNDLVRSVDENLQSRSAPPHLHLTTVYENISVDALPELREWVLAEGTKFHEKLRVKLAQFDKDTNPTLYQKRGGGRLMVCSFSHSLAEPENQ